MRFARARRPEQKEQRRASILAAARRLLSEHPLDEIRLTAMARAAGISKANVYRYFESREAVFLELLLVCAEEAIAPLEQKLARLGDDADVDTVAATFSAVLVAHPDFVRLFSALSTVLEKNVSAETIRAFKRQIAAVLIRPVNALHAALPTLSVANARRAMMHVLAHTSGLWAASHPPPHVAAVMQEPEFAPMALDYEAMVRDHTTLVLRALSSPA